MITSLAGILDALYFHGRDAVSGAPPDLIIEVPHGATRTADYTALAAQLTSPLPADLVDFFHVNTDAGAPELAGAIAEQLVGEQPARQVLVLRCLIPRTFIDCNRWIEASPEELRAGKVTPGLMPWITSAEDRALLRARYDDYVAAVGEAIAQLPAHGALVMLHSYAPRTVDVEVDRDIVVNLRRAYRPEVEPTWPLRPEVDVIARTTDGSDLAPRGVVDELRDRLAAAGIALAEGATYPLHPSTLAWHHVQQLPGRAVCIEVRRDLLAEAFTPFAEMPISHAKLARLAPPFTTALLRWW